MEQKQNTTNVIAIVASLIILIGCFMPWIQLGALITNRGIDNPDGAIMLVACVISGSLAFYNHSKNLTNNYWLFIVVGLIGIVTAYYDLTEVHTRANKLQESVGELNDYFGGSKKEVSKANFIGTGLYIVCAGSIGLILCGLGIFGAQTKKADKVEPIVENAEVVVIEKTQEEIEKEEQERKVQEEKEAKQKIENDKYNKQINKIVTVVVGLIALFIIFRLVQTLTK